MAEKDAMDRRARRNPAGAADSAPGWRPPVVSPANSVQIHPERLQLLQHGAPLGNTVQIVRLTDVNSVADSCLALSAFPAVRALLKKALMAQKRGIDTEEDAEAWLRMKEQRRISIDSLLNKLPHASPGLSGASDEDVVMSDVALGDVPGRKIKESTGSGVNRQKNLQPTVGEAVRKISEKENLGKESGSRSKGKGKESADEGKKESEQKQLADIMELLGFTSTSSSSDFDTAKRNLADFLSAHNRTPGGPTARVNPPPITWLKEDPQYDIGTLLKDIQPSISLPQLLDVSPKLRRDLADLLRSSQPRTRSRRVNHAGIVAPAITTLAQDDRDVDCLYITVFIEDAPVDLTLVDGGAMIELISDRVVKNLGLKSFPCNDLAMRLANDDIVRLPSYVWINVNVAGVLARIKAFVMPIQMSYNLLLSRRWTTRVKAVEDHVASNTRNVVKVEHGFSTVSRVAACHGRQGGAGSSCWGGCVKNRGG